jgi:hypothetical protein
LIEGRTGGGSAGRRHQLLWLSAACQHNRNSEDRKRTQGSTHIPLFFLDKLFTVLGKLTHDLSTFSFTDKNCPALSWQLETPLAFIVTCITNRKD